MGPGHSCVMPSGFGVPASTAHRLRSRHSRDFSDPDRLKLELRAWSFLCLEFFVATFLVALSNKPCTRALYSDWFCSLLSYLSPRGWLGAQRSISSRPKKRLPAGSCSLMAR